jgi:hypothetical protein
MAQMRQCVVGVKGFGCRPCAEDARHALAVGVRKPPREETAVGESKRCGLRYGDLSAAVGVLECRSNAG